MSNVIECICRLLPNKVLITIPKLQNDTTYVVVGICDLDTDSPNIIVKENKPASKGTLNVPLNLVGSIMVNDFGNDEDKSKICRS